MADIIIDFDGTVCSHDFSQVGKDIGAEPVLRELLSNGHNLILSTMRADRPKPKPTGNPEIRDVTGLFLTDAINWFDERNIPLYGIQEHPTQKNWTTSPKCYGHLIIDDTGLGIPLKSDPTISDRPFVDWVRVREWLVRNGYIREVVGTVRYLRDCINCGEVFYTNLRFGDQYCASCIESIKQRLGNDV